MNLRRYLFGLSLFSAAGLGLPAQAESFTSSASLAGSASSGSVSDSLHGSSHSADGNDRRADGDYRIIQIARLPQRADTVRISMRGVQAQPEIMLDLPSALFAKEQLAAGDLVHAQRRVYGFEFARADTGKAFFLVLADDWHDELAARPLARL